MVSSFTPEGQLRDGQEQSLGNQLPLYLAIWLAHTLGDIITQKLGRVTIGERPTIIDATTSRGMIELHRDLWTQLLRGSAGKSGAWTAQH